MPQNSNEYMKSYLAEHNHKTNCEICGGSFKKYNIVYHVKSKKHNKAVDKINVENNKNDANLRIINEQRAEIERLRNLISSK